MDHQTIIEVSRQQFDPPEVRGARAVTAVLAIVAALAALAAFIAWPWVVGPILLFLILLDT